MIDDVEGSVYEWLPLISHLYPGITPFNIWQLTYDFWLLYIAHARAYNEQEKANGQ